MLARPYESLESIIGASIFKSGSSREESIQIWQRKENKEHPTCQFASFPLSGSLSYLFNLFPFGTIGFVQSVVPLWMSLVLPIDGTSIVVKPCCLEGNISDMRGNMEFSIDHHVHVLPSTIDNP